MLEQKKENFNKIITRFKEELAKLRTGRANPALIDDIKVDYYGAPTPLKQIGSITVLESHQLLVTPWDKNVSGQIERAIRDSELGLNPANEGDKIRIQIPSLTEERRRDLTKLAGKIAEEARVKVRALREELVKEIRVKEENDEISKDERFRQQDKLQKVVDEYNEKIQELAEVKEKEIMTI